MVVSCLGAAAVAYQCLAPPTPHVKHPPKAVTYAGCRVSCPNGGYRLIPDMSPEECRARSGSGECTYRAVWK